MAEAKPSIFGPLPSSQLVDRAPELERLLAMAASGRSVRLAAPRRYGKTTLLNALADRRGRRTRWCRRSSAASIAGGCTASGGACGVAARTPPQINVPGVANVSAGAGAGVPAASSSLAARAARSTLIARDAPGPWRVVDPFLALWLTQPR